jgi:hypothetical protein
MNTSPQLSSIDGKGNEYAIQVLSSGENQSRIIPLSVLANHNGAFTFKAIELSGLEAQEVYFEDRLLKTFRLLSAGDSWSIQLSQGKTQNRFYIHYSPSNLPHVQNVSSQSAIYASGHDVFIKLSENQTNARVRIFNVLGQIQKDFTFNGSAGMHQFSAETLSGACIVQFISDQTNESSTFIFD